MLEPGGDPDLAEEPLRPQGGREIGMEHLDRHVPIVFPVVREKDRGHAAATEPPADGVLPAEGGVETGPDLCHAGSLRIVALWYNGDAKPAGRKDDRRGRAPHILDNSKQIVDVGICT